MSEDLVKILVIIAIISILIYYVLYALRKNRIIEGYQVGGIDEGGKKTDIYNIPMGATINSAEYYKKLKNNVAKISDELLIPKYRKTYEGIIISMDDYINGLMLKTILDIPSSDYTEDVVMTRIKTLNDLFISKTALNGVMKYMDKVR